MTLDLALRLHGDVIDVWKFFVPSGIALLGWVFAKREAWQPEQRYAVAVAWAGFSAINLWALIRSYRALEVMVAELRYMRPPPGGMGEKSFSALVDRLDMGGWEWAIAFHLLVDVIVFYFVLVRAGSRSGD